MFQAKPSVKSVTQQEEEQPIYPEEANSTDTALWPPRGYHRKPMQFRPDSMTSACIQSIGKEASAAQPDGDQSCNAERKAGSCIPAMLETSIQPSFIVNPYSVRRAGMTPDSPAWCNAASGRLHFQLPAAPGTSRKPSRARRCRRHRKWLKSARSRNPDALPAQGTASMIRYPDLQVSSSCALRIPSLQLEDTCTPS